MFLEDWQQFQKALFDTLNRNGSGTKLVYNLQKLLKLSKPSAYKKVSIETKLSLDEVIKIVKEYNLSFDQHIAVKSSPIAFFSDALRKMPQTPIDYLLNLQQHLNYITNLKNVYYTCLAGEVPIFHYMCFKKLISFKLHVWSYASWKISSNDKISLSHYYSDSELMDAVDKCVTTYYQFSGTEIWNIRMIDITIDQLMYFIPMKIFKSKNEVIQILDEIEAFIYHLEEICKSASKKIETSDGIFKSPVKIYMNEIIHSNEVFLVESDPGDMIFSAIDTPNFVRSNDSRMIKHVKEWLNTSIDHCTQISKEGEKDRKVMFETILSKFVAGKYKIINLANVYYGSE